MGQSHRVVLSLLILLTAVATVSQAEIPLMFSYQGKVTDSGGSPVVDGNWMMRFRIYDAATSGTVLWDSGDRLVAVAGGIFSILLGESPQPALSLAFDADYWLQVTFDGVTQTPRQRLSSAGYAYMASGLVAGTEVSGTVTSGTQAAIKGTNTATVGAYYGGAFTSASPAGSGVYGLGSATAGGNYGVHGRSQSSGGCGVLGEATATTGNTVALLGIAHSTGGRGLMAEATATTGTTYGVYATSASSAGRGIYAAATSTIGTTYGVYATSASTAGGYGVYATSASTAGGYGIYGWSTCTYGVNYGVFGKTSSTSGFGGAFEGRLRATASINAAATPNYHVALIDNSSIDTSPDVLALRVGYTGNPGFAINYITFFRGDDTAVGAIEGDGAGGVTFLSGGSDFAEYLPRLGGEGLEPGDVVGVFDGKVTKHTDGASQVMVVSTRPIVLGNNPGEDKAEGYARVAFIGQVEVKVRGAVEAGDLLMPSGLGDGTAVAVAGDAISAVQFRQVFGQAWEGSAESGVKRIRAAVGLLQHDPSVARLEAENRALRSENAEMRAEMQAAIATLQQRIAAIEESR